MRKFNAALSRVLDQFISGRIRMCGMNYYTGLIVKWPRAAASDAHAHLINGDTEGPYMRIDFMSNSFSLKSQSGIGLRCTAGIVDHSERFPPPFPFPDAHFPSVDVEVEYYLVIRGEDVVLVHNGHVRHH